MGLATRKMLEHLLIRSNGFRSDIALCAQICTNRSSLLRHARCAHPRRHVACMLESQPRRCCSRTLQPLRSPRAPLCLAAGQRRLAAHGRQPRHQPRGHLSPLPPPWAPRVDLAPCQPNRRQALGPLWAPWVPVHPRAAAQATAGRLGARWLECPPRRGRLRLMLPPQAPWSPLGPPPCQPSSSLPLAWLQPKRQLQGARRLGRELSSHRLRLPPWAPQALLGLAPCPPSSRQKVGPPRAPWVP